MFLTRFQINPQRREARKLLGSPQALHAAVLASFPNLEPTSCGRVLWRNDNVGGRSLLHIASPETPDLNHLVENAGWPTVQSWETRPYEPFLDGLRQGEHFAFRLAANPVHSVRPPGEGRGKVVAHASVEHQERWLLERQVSAGFEISSGYASGSGILITDRRTASFRRQNAQVTLRIVTYEGLLIVSDVERLRNTLTHGIGRARGYGCGLLTLAAAPRR
jgi:CRISPR system Cascade subunit CasE